MAGVHDLALVDMRYLLSPDFLGQHAGLLMNLPLPPLFYEFMLAHHVRPSVRTAALAVLLAPLVFAVAGLAFDLRRLHAPMMVLLQLALAAAASAGLIYGLLY